MSYRAGYSDAQTYVRSFDDVVLYFVNVDSYVYIDHGKTKRGNPYMGLCYTYMANFTSTYVGTREWVFTFSSRVVKP